MLMLKLNSLLLAMTLLGGCKLGDGDLDALQRCYREDGGAPGGCRSLLTQQDLRSDAIDLQTPDLAPVLADMSFDPRTPPTSIAACRSPRAGWQITAKMAACRVDMQLPDQICNDLAGWVPCQANQISAAVCAAIPWGFFGTRQHGRQASSSTPDSTMVCTWNGGVGGTSSEQRFIFGCGKANAVVTWDITDNPCGGFTRAIPCHGTAFSAPSSWTCPYPQNSDQDADQVQADAADGELCCHA